MILKLFQIIKFLLHFRSNEEHFLTWPDLTCSATIVRKCGLYTSVTKVYQSLYTLGPITDAPDLTIGLGLGLATTTQFVNILQQYTYSPTTITYYITILDDLSYLQHILSLSSTAISHGSTPPLQLARSQYTTLWIYQCEYLSVLSWFSFLQMLQPCVVCFKDLPDARHVRRATCRSCRVVQFCVSSIILIIIIDKLICNTGLCMWGTERLWARSCLRLDHSGHFDSGWTREQVQVLSSYRQW